MSKRVFALLVLRSAAILSAPLDIPSMIDAWDSAPLGIAITNVVYDTYGVTVQFETDLKPPYITGIYDVVETGLKRCYPLAEVSSVSKSAFIPGDFTDITTVVEVMTPSFFDTRHPHRLLGHDEVKRIRENLHRAPISLCNSSSDYRNSDIRYAPNHIMSDELLLKLIDNHVWVAFEFSTNKHFSLSLQGRRCEQAKSEQIVEVLDITERYTANCHYAIPPIYETNNAVVVEISPGKLAYDHPTDNDYVLDKRCRYNSDGSYSIIPSASTNIYHKANPVDLCTNIVECAVTNFSHTIPVYWTKQVHKRIVGKTYSYPAGEYTDVRTEEATVDASDEDIKRGLGWRVVYNDLTGETLVSRAYSALSNCSQSVFLPRAFAGITSYEGRRLSIDVLGRVISIHGNNQPSHD